MKKLKKCSFWFWRYKKQFAISDPKSLYSIYVRDYQFFLIIGSEGSHFFSLTTRLGLCNTFEWFDRISPFKTIWAIFLCPYVGDNQNNKDGCIWLLFPTSQWMSSNLTTEFSPAYTRTLQMQALNACPLNFSEMPLFVSTRSKLWKFFQVALTLSVVASKQLLDWPMESPK